MNRWIRVYEPRSFGVEVRQFRHQNGSVGSAVLEPVEDFDARVVATDFVSLEDGTGIIHIAPAFGDKTNSYHRQFYLPSFIRKEEDNYL